MREEVRSSTWNGCAERHEGDGRDGILKSHRAAESASHIANDCSEHSNPNDGDGEAEPTSHSICSLFVLFCFFLVLGSGFRFVFVIKGNVQKSVNVIFFLGCTHTVGIHSYVSHKS